MFWPHLPFDILPILFWVFLIALLGTGVAFALLASRRRLPYAIWVAGGALVLALMLTLSATTSFWSAAWDPAGGPTAAMIAWRLRALGPGASNRTFSALIASPPGAGRGW